MNVLRQLHHSGRHILHIMCLVPVVMFSQQHSRITDVRFHGLTSIPATEARQILLSGLRTSSIPDSLRSGFDPLLIRYQQLGFYSARIDSIEIVGGAERSDNTLDVWVNEGSRAMVDSIVFHSMRLFSVYEVLPFFETQRGSVLIDKNLEKDIHSLITQYSNHGYPFVSVTVGSIVSRPCPGSEDDCLTLSLDIVEGPRVTIDRVDISGNNLTRPDVILRESRISIGDIYRLDDVEKARLRLLRLGFFSSVDDPDIVMSESGSGLKLRVTETAMNTFDGVIGYLPPVQGNDHGTFTGMVNVLLKNMFGTGRRLGARWQHDNVSTQELQFQYLEPWIAGLPVNVGLGFFQRQQDTTYVQRTYDARTEVTAFDNLTLSALFSFDQVIPSATMSGFFVTGSTSVSTGIEIRYDMRDDPAAPTRGYLYRSDVRVGRKTVASQSAGVEERSSLQRYTLDVEWYLSTFSRQVLASSIHARELRSGAIREPDMFRFGGARTLRGYRENQFLGSRIVWGSLEYRLSVGRRSFGYLFTDLGYYLYPGDPELQLPENQASKTGYGLGFQLETGLGILRVSYALGAGDTFTTGKIHFGIINDF
jgi:outer membrane protein insertion porin family